MECRHFHPHSIVSAPQTQLYPYPYPIVWANACCLRSFRLRLARFSFIISPHSLLLLNAACSLRHNYTKYGLPLCCFLSHLLWLLAANSLSFVSGYSLRICPAGCLRSIYALSTAKLQVLQLFHCLSFFFVSLGN